MLFSVWISDWLRIYKRRVLKPSTFISYQFASRLIRCDVDLERLTAFDLQECVNRIVDGGAATSTIRHCLTIMRQSLKKAVALGYCSRDVLYFLDCVEYPSTNRREVRSFTRDELDRFETESLSSFYGDMFRFMLYTGIRVGECIGLQWQDVDLYARTVHIQRTDYRGVVTEPKTASSRRMVPLDSASMVILRRAWNGRDTVCDSGRVFCNTAGSPVSYRSLLDAYKRILDRCGIDPCGIHVLRHTYATFMLRAGVDVKSLSALLGHSDIEITLRTYCDVDFEDLRTAVGKRDQLRVVK